MDKLLTKLNRPLVGTVVLPADARVDPQHFPEDEFPVNCPKCDYLLRGLPEERCPECGEPFDRGRLLVQQYVERRGRSQKRLAYLAIVTVSLVIFKPAGILIGAWLGGSTNAMYEYVRIAWWIELALLALICAWAAVDLRRWHKRSTQRQAILRHLSRGSS